MSLRSLRERPFAGARRGCSVVAAVGIGVYLLLTVGKGMSAGGLADAIGWEASGHRATGPQIVSCGKNSAASWRCKADYEEGPLDSDILVEADKCWSARTSEKQADNSPTVSRRAARVRLIGIRSDGSARSLRWPAGGIAPNPSLSEHENPIGSERMRSCMP
jgi:hypothetical protein